MPTEHIVALLIQERDRLNRAIEALQGPTKHRGRPPKNPLSVVTAVPPQANGGSATKKRIFTAEQRKAQAKRMKNLTSCQEAPQKRDQTPDCRPGR
jgi:hypothetical protein